MGVREAVPREGLFLAPRADPFSILLVEVERCARLVADHPQLLHNLLDVRLLLHLLGDEPLHEDLEAVSFSASAVR